MDSTLLIISIIILLCILANRFSNKFGMPVLLLFMLLGIAFGVDGLFGFEFDDYNLTGRVCSIALVFIMFYGGFGTKWSVAKPVAVRSVLLSTLGVVMTALLTAAFCIWGLGFGKIEGFLVGAVLSSTDAASVFSILRSKKLSLKDKTASMLEIESGSNDPMAYMMTALGISMAHNNSQSPLLLVISQIAIGVIVGVVVALTAQYIMRKTDILTDGIDTIFVVAVVLIAYALPLKFNGNGYLSVYLTGIMLGNSKINNKNNLVHFFDGITNLAQITIFFLLGLLATPHMIPGIFLTSVAIALFLMIVARPVTIFALLAPFKSSVGQCGIVSWAGLRGASSIVFAIEIMSQKMMLGHDIFHIVFMVALLSVAFQGTMLPLMAKKMNMIDEDFDVLKTFNDYQEEETMTLMRMYIPKGHNWENKLISDVSMPTGSLALMIKRDSDTVIPKGSTRIMAGDSVILSVPAYHGKNDIQLEEIIIDKSHEWNQKRISELTLPDNILVAVIKRAGQNIIPSGHTIMQEGDTVVVYK